MNLSLVAEVIPRKAVGGGGVGSVAGPVGVEACAEARVETNVEKRRARRLAVDVLTRSEGLAMIGKGGGWLREGCIVYPTFLWLRKLFDGMLDVLYMFGLQS